MAYVVSCGAQPLVFDTLPALKVRHWQNAQSRDKIYTMARLYFLNGGLRLSLAAFQRTPPAHSHVTFAFGGPGGAFAQATLSPSQALLFTRPKRPAAPGWMPSDMAPTRLDPDYFSGVDEQGWYWGAGLEVPAEAVAAVGVAARPGECFHGALFKHGGAADGPGGPWGASHPTRSGSISLDFEAFSPMKIVSY